MARSMTAFAQHEEGSPFGQLCCELQSVNRRHLEVDIHLPRLLHSLELESLLQAQVSASCQRGKVTARFSVASCPTKVDVQEDVLKQMQAVFAQIEGSFSKDVKLDPSPFAAALLQSHLAFEIRLDPSQKPALFEALQRALRACIAKFINAKKAEGKALAADLLSRLAAMRSSVDQIEKLSASSNEKLRAKLQARLLELFSAGSELDERIAKEVALLSEKADIAEEITRFRIHVQTFEKALSNDAAIGKTLEFLCQELLREANTMGSKANCAELTSYVIATKAEIERIREQVQNLE